MKDLLNIINEVREFNGESKVYGGDIATLTNFLINSGINQDDFEVTSNGVQDLTDAYRKIIPNTKLDGRKASDILSAVETYFDGKQPVTPVGNVKIKKQRKNLGVARGSYDAAERAAERAYARNSQAMSGTKEYDRNYINN